MADNAVTSTSTNVYRIEPLTGAENYAVWKIKMIDILTGQDLWEYVNGTTTLPSDLASQSGWRKKDRLALSTIKLRVANKMLVYVASSTSAKEAWDMLKSLFSNKLIAGFSNKSTQLTACVTLYNTINLCHASISNCQ